MYGGDEVNAIVLDVGTYQVKAGYAGEDTPKFVFPSAVGDTGGANGDAMETDGPQPGRFHAGTHALSFRRDGMEVASPFNQDGQLSNWEVLEALYDHALKDQMRLDPGQHPLMLAEPTRGSREAREKVVELVFEKYGVPATFMSKDAVLSSFSTGRQTSLVVDAGHGSTVVAAVHDGYVLNRSVVRTPLGGHLLTRCMRHSVEAGGTAIRPRYAFKKVEKEGGGYDVKDLDLPGTTDSYRAYQVEAVAQDIKDTICRVSDQLFDPDEHASIPTVAYELPDGQEIHVGPDRFTVPEVLFNPPLLKRFGGAGGDGRDALPGLQLVVNDCIQRCDVDVRRELYNGIVLTGGTAMFATLRDRLERELTEIAPQMAKVKVVCPSSTVERRFSVWIGGSILSCLGSFQQMWMSKAEYQEHGAGLIHKKAP